MSDIMPAMITERLNALPQLYTDFEPGHTQWASWNDALGIDGHRFDDDLRFINLQQDFMTLPLNMENGMSLDCFEMENENTDNDNVELNYDEEDEFSSNSLWPRINIINSPCQRVCELGNGEEGQKEDHEAQLWEWKDINVTGVQLPNIEDKIDDISMDDDHHETHISDGRASDHHQRVHNDSVHDVGESNGVDQINCNNDDNKEVAEYKGLRLVHLLVACAEAMAGEAMDVVDVILNRLQELATPIGTSIERVAYYMCHALQSSISGHGHMELMDPNNIISRDNILGAFQLLHQVYPHIRFAHFTANQFILESIKKNIKKDMKIHIIDFDIVEGLQWAPLMEALKLEGICHEIRITAIKWAESCGVISLSSVEETGRRLSEMAMSMGISFVWEETQLEDLNKYAMEDDDDSYLIVNCMWQLPHMCKRRKSRLYKFLMHVRPNMLVFANGAFESKSSDLVSRFSECFNHFGGVFDSLEAGLPDQGVARALVERTFFYPTIHSSILLIQEADEVDQSVREVIEKCGFIKKFGAEDGLAHANALVNRYRDLGGALYSVAVESDEFVLKWALTPLLLVSAWELP